MKSPFEEGRSQDADRRRARRAAIKSAVIWAGLPMSLLIGLSTHVERHGYALESFLSWGFALKLAVWILMGYLLGAVLGASVFAALRRD